MKYALALLALAAAAALPARAQTERQTTASDIRMTINNIGLIGNAFRGSYSTQGYKSCEYPAGSGVEHLFQGGLWVGAEVGGQHFVTSGAIDASAGYAPGNCNFEFTAPSNQPVREISSLVRNPGYNPLAISHQDFIANFTDKNFTVPGTTIPVDRGCAAPNSPHRPLGLDVRMETYNWNYSYANFFVILNYSIQNTGTDTLKNVGVGYWADGVIRNVRRTPPGGTPFFDKGGNGYIDSLWMGYEFDANGDLGFTESYIGLKFLGSDWITRKNERDSSIYFHPGCHGFADAKVFYNTWQFNSQNPNFFTPNSEQERYLRLLSGLNYRDNWDTPGGIRDQIRQPSNRSNLISVGPIPHLGPGEKFNIAFAVVLARKVEDGLPNVADTRKQKEQLARNAFWAQTTYNGEDRNCNGALDPGEDDNGDGKLTRYTLPAPPETPIARVEAKENKAVLYWTDNAERSVDPISKRHDFRGYRIYKSRFAFDLANVTELAGNLELYQTYDRYASGEAPYLNALPQKGTYNFAGDSLTYAYRLEIPNLQNGWQHVISLTAYDSGNAATNLASLETAQLENIFRVFPGTEPGKADLKNNEPFAYPDPYYGSAAWEGGTTRPEERKLYFANLPERCTIRVYTQAGDLVDIIEHEGLGYTGQDSKWFTTFSNPAQNQLSGGEHAWDLLSKSSQIISRGTYLFTVTDKASKKEFRGRFTVIK